MRTILTTISCILFISLIANAQTIDLSVTGSGTCNATQTLSKVAVGAFGDNIYQSVGFRIIFTGTRWEVRVTSLTGGFYNNSTQTPNPPCLSDGGWVHFSGNSCYNQIIQLSGDGCGTVPTPVELLSFDAFQQLQTIQLNWKTATEINNDYFELERSNDGENFETIETIEGNGNSIEAQSYQYIDKNISNGNYYYRLKQVDFDGAFEYHQTVFVEVLDLNENLKIYPTITSDIIFIDSKETNNMLIQIYNSNGQLIKELANVKQQVSIGDLPSGHYWLRIFDNQNAINQFIIKQ